MCLHCLPFQGTQSDTYQQGGIDICRKISHLLGITLCICCYAQHLNKSEQKFDLPSKRLYLRQLYTTDMVWIINVFKSEIFWGMRCHTVEEGMNTGLECPIAITTHLTFQSINYIFILEHPTATTRCLIYWCDKSNLVQTLRVTVFQGYPLFNVSIAVGMNHLSFQVSYVLETPIKK